jgi:hypothetical protein
MDEYLDDGEIVAREATAGQTRQFGPSPVSCGQSPVACGPWPVAYFISLAKIARV